MHMEARGSARPTSESPECEAAEERTKQEQIKEWNVAHKAISQHQLCTVCFVRIKLLLSFVLTEMFGVLQRSEFVEGRCMSKENISRVRGNPVA